MHSFQSMESNPTYSLQSECVTPDHVENHPSTSADCTSLLLCGRDCQSDKFQWPMMIALRYITIYFVRAYYWLDFNGRGQSEVAEQSDSYLIWTEAGQMNFIADVLVIVSF